MKLKKLAISLAAGAALIGAASTAHAITITTYDGPTAGTFSGFGGFDWASDGLAVATNFGLTSVGQSVVTDLTYWSTAANVVDPAQKKALSLKGLNNELGYSYEYTLVASLTETATCLAASGGICTSASFILNSGVWSVFYDSAVNANRLLGTGFTDGVKILSGNFTAGFAGIFTATIDGSGNVGGTGSNTLHGNVQYTNLAYISPALGATTAGTELKFNFDRTDDGALPSATPYASVVCDRASGVVCMQADANQSFAAVPEPGSIALLGLGMFGLGAIRRRKQ